DRDLKTCLFGKVSYVVSVFVERFPLETDEDYVGLLELHFKDEASSKKAFGLFRKYDNNFGSDFIYHDLYFIRSGKLLYVVESMPETRNHILKNEIIDKLKGVIDFDEIRQRK
ncbi:MAG: hypothetical protein IT258_16165, partial [Saprospiraceae bacterium]|nr:hypothetical protein [Saprospiraceae bacterium]